MAVRAVFFDVGETLVDETRLWRAWADWLGVPHFAFFAMMGAVIDRGEHHQRIFDMVRPGFDLEREEEARVAAGFPNGFSSEDIYPDVAPCLRDLRAAGYLLGIAGNQPAAAERVLAKLGLPVEVVASSQTWGVEKPSPAFFNRLVQVAGVAAHEIAYVGDRLDNDVLPALAAGMVTVHLRRGPWGYLHALRPEVQRAHLRLDTLAALPDALRRWTQERET